MFNSKMNSDILKLVNTNIPFYTKTITKKINYDNLKWYTRTPIVVIIYVEKWLIKMLNICNNF